MGQRRLSHLLTVVFGAILLTIPWLGLHAAFGVDLATSVIITLSGIAVLGTSSFLMWGAETAEANVPRAPTPVILAVFVVAPEYAVDALYVWEAGTNPGTPESAEAAGLAVANMTGVNRVLIGISRSAIAFFTAYRARDTDGETVESRPGLLADVVWLNHGIATKILLLSAVTVLVLFIPLEARIGAVNMFVLVGPYVAYIFVATSSSHEDEEQISVPTYLRSYRKPKRIITTLSLFVFSGIVTPIAVGPFAHGLETLGESVGIPSFLTTRWVAPLTSESPELVAVACLVSEARSTADFNAPISSKLNQWALLTGTFVLVHSLSLGYHGPLPLDIHRMGELWLMAARSCFAIAVPITFSISLHETVVLLGLFLAQFVYSVAGLALMLPIPGLGTVIFDGATPLIDFSAVYLVVGATLFVRRCGQLTVVTKLSIRRVHGDYGTNEIPAAAEDWPVPLTASDALLTDFGDPCVVIGIVVSCADSASVHTDEHLLKLADWNKRTDGDRPDADDGGAVFSRNGFELRELDDLHIDLDGPAEAFDANLDLAVVISRYAGETSALPTAHFTGNFSPVNYGDESGRFARACPNAQCAVIEAFCERAPDNYEAGIEATRHDPTKPTVPPMFVELGSDERQWGDSEGVRAVTVAILDIKGVTPDADRQFIGFGGGHYVPWFECVLNETNWRIGHIAANRQLKVTGVFEDNRNVLRRTFETSAADPALVDDSHDDLVAVLEAEGFRVVSGTWVHETVGIPLDRVAAPEADVTTVEGGLRFGTRVDAGNYEVVSLPDDPLDEAQSIDLGAALSVVRETTVTFHTTEGGTRAMDHAAVAGDSYDELASRLCDALREKHDSVIHNNGAVTTTTYAFDPAAARKFSVPEGPAFGKLSAGQSVEVDDETAAPEDVSKGRLIEFSV